MKSKKLFVSLFASLFAVSSIVSLTSCQDEKDPTDDPNGEVENQDLEIVQTAINALNVQSTATENFTLVTSAIGGVSISWASNNTDVISISTNSAVVSRPIGGQDVTVTLTATAVLRNETLTKQFQVIVSPIADNSSTVAEIKETEDGKVVEATGVVSEFVYSADSKRGFYLTDSTGTIYVYDQTQAEKLSIGDKVYLSATTQKYSSQSLYSGAIQLKTVSSLMVTAQNQEIDYTAAVTDKTIADITTATDDAGKRDSSIVGTIYELTGIVSYQSEGYALCIKDLVDSTKAINIYYAALIADKDALDAATNYAPLIKNRVGEIVRVRFVVNSMSGADGYEWRGTVLSVLPQSEITAEDQAKGIATAIKTNLSINTTYVAEEEVTLPTSITSFDKCSIAWSLKEGSAGAAIADNKLTITPTATMQQFTLVATVTIDGATEPVVVEYAQASVCTSFESITHAEYVAAEANSFVIVEGTVIYGYAGGSNPYFYMLDNLGNGYHINVAGLGLVDADFATGGKYAKGSVVKVYGTKTMYNTFPTVASVASIEKLTSTANTTPSDIDAAIEADKLGDRYGTYFVLEQVKYDGANLVTPSGKIISHYDVFKTGITLTAGKIYEYYGIVVQNSNNGAVQVAVLEATEVTENVAVEFVAMDLNEVFESSYSKAAEVEVPTTLYGHTISYVVNTESTTVVYADGKVTITASVNQTSTVSYYLDGNTTASGTLTVVVDLDSKVETMSHSEAATGNMDGTNQASKFGLTEGFLSVVSNKAGQQNHVGVNKDGTFRLYAGSNKSQDGAEIIISIAPGFTGKIKSIEITLGATVAAYSVNGVIDAAPAKNGSKSFTVDSNQVVIKNVAESGQVYVKSIEIKYTAKASENVVLSINPGIAELNADVQTEYTFAQSDTNKTVTLPTAEDFATIPYNVPFLGWTDGTDIITSIDVTETMTVIAVFDISLTVAEALEMCTTTGATQTTIDFAVAGTVKSIDGAYSSQYKNITITLEDETGTISCYRLAGGEDIEVGSNLIVVGRLINYKDNTPQFNAGATYTIITPETEA